MNSLESKIEKIQSGLHDLNHNLWFLEGNAKISISTDVGGMRSAVSDGRHRIEYISTETRTFLHAIENGDPKSLDLSPQMQWLKANLTSVVHDFQKAESCADSAMSSAMTYRYDVQDIHRRIEATTTDLNNARADGTRLTQEAQSELDSSIQRMNLIQIQIRENETQIQNKASYCSLLKSQIASKESSIADLGRKISAAQSKRSDEKAKGVIVGVGGSLLGIGMIALSGGLLAPFVGGAIAGGSMITAADAAINASDLKKEIDAARSSRSTLQRNTSEAEQEVSRLQVEKNRLERLVSDYKSEVETRKNLHRSYTEQISQFEKINTDINQLTDRASSTTTTVQDTEIELQKIKEQLEQCSVLLDSNSTELQEQSSSFLDHLMVERLRRRRQFMRQKNAILQVSESLERIHTGIPTLLTAGNSKFLDIKSSSTFSTSFIEVNEPMPSLLSFETIETNPLLSYDKSVRVPGAFPSNEDLSSMH